MSDAGNKTTLSDTVLRTLDDAAMPVSYYANQGIKVIRRDEAEAIIRAAVAEVNARHVTAEMRDYLTGRKKV